MTLKMGLVVCPEESLTISQHLCNIPEEQLPNIRCSLIDLA